MSYYKLFVPKQAVGASLVYFDFFNTTGSGRVLNIESVIPIVSGAVAVTGVVGVDLILTRTTAVGTGGTAATFEGTDTTAMTITHQNGTNNLVGAVSARITPTGGATAGAVLSWRSVFTEETSAATYNQVIDMVRNGVPSATPITVRPGSGIRVVQGTVASVGNIGFDVSFSFSPLP